MGQLKLSGLCGMAPTGDKKKEKAHVQRENGPSGTIFCELCKGGDKERRKGPICVILTSFSDSLPQPGYTARGEKTALGYSRAEEREAGSLSQEKMALTISHVSAPALPTAGWRPPLL